MAYLELHYHSDALKKAVTVNVILPERAKTLIGMETDGNSTACYKTLYLLHGLSDDHTIWMRRTSIERYANDCGIAVVMPSVDRSWYTDTASGAPYFTFLTDELPRVCRGYFRGMSERREDNLIAGLSMGGYGAIKAALLCPERFGYCASLSGALNVAARTMKASELEEWRGIFGFSLESADELKGTDHDLFAIAARNQAAGVAFPKLFMWCGTEDRLLESNRLFDAHLTDLGVPHLYQESEGNHSWKWWDLHIQDALRYLLEN